MTRSLRRSMAASSSSTADAQGALSPLSPSRHRLSPSKLRTTQLGSRFTRSGVQYEFHHLGVPTQDVKPNERYNSQSGIYTSDSDCGLVRIQWHRFDADSSVDPVLRMLPHPAFKVSDLDA